MSKKNQIFEFSCKYIYIKKHINIFTFANWYFISLKIFYIHDNIKLFLDIWTLCIFYNDIKIYFSDIKITKNMLDTLIYILSKYILKIFIDI